MFQKPSEQTQLSLSSVVRGQIDFAIGEQREAALKFNKVKHHKTPMQVYFTDSDVSIQIVWIWYAWLEDWGPHKDVLGLNPARDHYHISSTLTAAPHLLCFPSFSLSENRKYTLCNTLANSRTGRINVMWQQQGKVDLLWLLCTPLLCVHAFMFHICVCVHADSYGHVA